MSNNHNNEALFATIGAVTTASLGGIIFQALGALGLGVLGALGGYLFARFLKPLLDKLIDRKNHKKAE